MSTATIDAPVKPELKVRLGQVWRTKSGHLTRINSVADKNKFEYPIGTVHITRPDSENRRAGTYTMSGEASNGDDLIEITEAK